MAIYACTHLLKFKALMATFMWSDWCFVKEGKADEDPVWGLTM